MHEVAIAEEIKNAVLEQAKEKKAKKINKISMSFGELTSVVPDALDFAFEAVSAGTIMEGAEIEIETIKMKGRCKECGKKFRIKDFNYICPKCSSVRIQLTEGKEMIIKTIDMEL